MDQMAWCVMAKGIIAVALTGVAASVPIQSNMCTTLLLALQDPTNLHRHGIILSRDLTPR